MQRNLPHIWGTWCITALHPTFFGGTCHPVPRGICATGRIPHTDRRSIQSGIDTCTSPMKCCDRCPRYGRRQWPNTGWTGCSWHPSSRRCTNRCTAAETTGRFRSQDAGNIGRRWDTGWENIRHSGPPLARLQSGNVFKSLFTYLYLLFIYHYINLFRSFFHRHDIPSGSLPITFQTQIPDPNIETKDLEII